MKRVVLLLCLPAQALPRSGWPWRLLLDDRTDDFLDAKRRSKLDMPRKEQGMLKCSRRSLRRKLFVTLQSLLFNYFIFHPLEAD